MNAKDDRIRALVAEEAADWFLINRGTVDAAARQEFAQWVKTSPMHVEEYLGIAQIAQDMGEACALPDSSLEDLLAQARAEGDEIPNRGAARVSVAAERYVPRPRFIAAVAMVGIAALGVALFWWRSDRGVPGSAGEVSVATVTAVPFATQHGEQLTQRLSDGSVLHLNTDTAVAVFYSPKSRLVQLKRGQVLFEVTHDPERAFRVVAGAAEVVAIGTQFDVYLKNERATVVTVLEGRVKVEPATLVTPGTHDLASTDAWAHPGDRKGAPPAVEVAAGQQVQVDASKPIPAPSAIDPHRASAWLHHQIVFEHEPLELVAAEFNRYASTPVEIDTPALKALKISGVFSTDDTESFVAFLHSLDGVRVRVTPTSIHVSR